MNLRKIHNKYQRIGTIDMMIFGKRFLYMRGATAYEFQYGQRVFRIVHLSGGGHFVWNKPWRRFSTKVYPADEN